MRWRRASKPELGALNQLGYCCWKWEGQAGSPNFGRKQTSIISVASLIAKPFEPPATPLTLTLPRSASLD